MKKSLMAPMLLAATLASALPVRADTLAYTTRYLDGIAADINNNGHIAVTRVHLNEVNLMEHFAYVVDTQGNDVRSLGGWGFHTYVHALNDGGTAAGAISNSSTPEYAIRMVNGQSQRLATGNAIMTHAAAINGAGTIVGTATFGPTTPGGDWSTRAAVWNGSSVTYLPSQPQTSANTAAADINASGQVAGYSEGPITQALRWDNGAVVMLEDGTSLDSRALAINDDGWAVGYVTEDTGRATATLWQGDSRVPLSINGVAHGINSAGAIVGHVNGRATLWLDGVAHDLNDFRSAWMVQAGVVLENAIDINDAGAIIGTLYNPQAEYSQRYASFVMTVAAVPEPATWTMALGGLALIGAAGRARRRHAPG